MANNNILRFGENAEPSDTLTDSEYQSDSDRPIGHQVGVARNTLANKLGQGTSAIASALAQVMVDRSGESVSDSDSSDSLVSKLKSLIDDASTLTGNAPRDILPQATTSAAGIVERATDDEASDQTDTEKYTTPAQLSNFRRQILDSTYPVGKVEWFDSSDNPADAFDMPWSTWQRYAQGQTLVSEGQSPDGDAKDAGTSGGQTSVALTAEQNGPHKHGMFYNDDSGTGRITNLDVTASAGRDNTGDRDFEVGYFENTKPNFASTSTEGGSESHENMPPYLVAYAWVRTA